jgi:hypothetical protein
MQTRILIPVILLIFFAFSCDKEIGRCDLTESQKQLIPYEKDQIISFIDDKGQSFDATVIKSELVWNQTGEGGAFHEEYITYRRKSVFLESQAKNLDIFVQVFANTTCLSGYGDCSLKIDITDQKSYSKPTWVFYLEADTEGVFETDGISVLFYESIEINNKVFHDVIEKKYSTEVLDGRGGKYRQVPQLFYNKTYGILQINIDDENLLTIEFM